MGKKLRVAGSATPEEVRRAYRESRDRHERERLMAISLGQQGQWTLEEIGEILKRSRVTIIRWVRAYRQGGVKGLVERHYEGERRKPSLRGQELEELRKGLEEGKWKSAREIQRWLRGERNKELKLGAIYYWLRQMRASWKVPRKSHKKKTLSKKRSLKRSWCPA